MPGPLTIETHPGQPVSHRGIQLTPFALSWRLRLPTRSSRASFNLVWTRPISVLVSYPDGRETVLPVRDPTRQITWTLLGVCLAAVLSVGMMNLRYRRQKQNG